MKGPSYHLCKGSLPGSANISYAAGMGISCGPSSTVLNGKERRSTVLGVHGNFLQFLFVSCSQTLEQFRILGGGGGAEGGRDLCGYKGLLVIKACLICWVFIFFFSLALNTTVLCIFLGIKLAFALNTRKCGLKQ